jgi:hypothetical protein
MLAPKKKLVSVLFSALTLALFGLVVFLLFRVRELYQEHQKLQRLHKYAEEVNNEFIEIQNIINLFFTLYVKI